MLSLTSCSAWHAALALPAASGMLSRAAATLGGRGRRLSTTAASGSAATPTGGSNEELGGIPLAFPAVCIWGSNTGVGKTLFSAGLAAACRRAGLPVLYLKPVQTGFPADSDARLVAAAAGLPLAEGPHAAQLAGALAGSSSSSSSSSAGCAADLAKTLYAWRQPVSPHLAVETEGRPASDAAVAAAMAAELRGFAEAPGSWAASSAAAGRVAIVETAGGVASPGPSGTLQCDLLRPLRLPGVLVGDGRLGGISATLSAYDSLTLRGHQVPLVALMDGSDLGNAAAIQRHLRGKAQVLAFPICQPPPAGAAAAGQQQQPAIDASLAAWLAASAPQFDCLLAMAREAHAARLAQLQGAAGDALRMLWWPFTQHASVAGAAGVTVIDGRVGESFSVYRPQQGAAPAAAAADTTATGSTSSGSPSSSSSGGGGGSLELLYDACASWWTQGVSAAAQPELVRAISAAAARFGHVMFPENAHEPAVELARRLLGTVGQGWAGRVFYSDDGSTAVEVALKMAFRKFMIDKGLLESGVEMQVLGLTEGYHGDTLGAMDAVSPSPFNGRLQTPWYTGRGLFLDPPTVALQQGQWRISLPPDMEAAAAAAAAVAAELVPGARKKPFARRFDSQAELFDVAQRMGAGGGSSESSSSGGGGSSSGGGGGGGAGGAGSGTASLYPFYRRHIQQQLDEYAAAALLDGRTGAAGPGGALGSSGGAGGSEGLPARALGACILEPVLQGAGGMRLIDPLYQRALVDECRGRGIPVIYDEVFTGFWRLGLPSGGAALGAPPDVACYAKLLTGGTLPLSATLAREEVFAAFEGDTKAQALLHGHSYSAHPIGCAAGVAALSLFRDPELNPNWCTPEAPGRCRRQAAAQQEQPQRQQQPGSELQAEVDGVEAACCGGPCGRLLPLWDEAAVAALSHHPRVRGVVPLGTVLAVQLRADDGEGGYASNAAAAVVRRLRAAGVYGRPLGDVVYLMVTPMTDRARCGALLAALAAALDEQ